MEEKIICMILLYLGEDGILKGKGSRLKKNTGKLKLDRPNKDDSLNLK